MHDGAVLFALAGVSRRASFRTARSRDHAPDRASSRRSQRRYRSGATGLLAIVLGFSPVAQAAAGPMCRPSLTLKDVEFSEAQPPAAERRWSAVVAVDASRCAANARGHFDIVFSRIKEIGLETEVRAQFTWTPPAVNIHVDFWVEEAVEVKRFWIDNVSPCECGG